VDVSRGQDQAFLRSFGLERVRPYPGSSANGLQRDSSCNASLPSSNGGERSRALTGIADDHRPHCKSEPPTKPIAIAVESGLALGLVLAFHFEADALH
jgi:hypothetical protein